jgi:hypothetical protein
MYLTGMCLFDLSRLKHVCPAVRIAAAYLRDTLPGPRMSVMLLPTAVLVARSHKVILLETFGGEKRHFG